jgi:DNA-binding PadR family transcriptional regulator
MGGDLDYRGPIYQNLTVKGRLKPLPVAALHIVLALLEGELHGYALMRRVDELSNGAVRLGPGTLYGTINRLLADGLIEETTDRVARADTERRRYYQLTSDGRATALDELTRLQSLVHRVGAHVPRGATP